MKIISQKKKRQCYCQEKKERKKERKMHARPRKSKETKRIEKKKGNSTEK